MSLVDLSLFPACLKKIFPYLARANEIVGRNPSVAYFCVTYALELGIKLKATVSQEEKKDATNALVLLMEEVEALKTKINPNKEDGQKIVELFTLKVFKKAADLEKMAVYNNTTVKLFMMSSYLFDVLKQFEGGYNDGIKEKQRFARWKISEIRKVQRGEKSPPEPVVESEDPPSIVVQPPVVQMPARPVRPSAKQFSPPPVQRPSGNVSSSTGKQGEMISNRNFSGRIDINKVHEARDEVKKAIKSLGAHSIREARKELFSALELLGGV